MLKNLLYYSCLALSCLPWWMLYGASSVLAWVVFHLRCYRYKTVMMNLGLAFPEKSEKERRRIARDFYRHFADSIVETLKLMTASDATLRRKVEFRGWEQLDVAASERRPVVLYLGHYGNWELVPTITWVNPAGYVNIQIYKPLKDSAIGRVMERIRNRFGAVNLPQARAFRELLRYSMEGKPTITGFIADQRPKGKKKNWTRFLGLPTAYLAGGEEIGRRINAVYYYIDIECIGRGRSRFTLKKVEPAADEPDYPISVAYMRMLETTIRRDPAPWLWTHRRWAGQLSHTLPS